VGAGRTWIFVAILIISVVPFTLLVIEPLNEQIRAIDPSAEPAIELLMRWGRLHWFRTVASGAAFVMCLAGLSSQIRTHGTRQAVKGSESFGSQTLARRKTHE
jgi:uncharacterized membrane protein